MVKAEARVYFSYLRSLPNLSAEGRERELSELEALDPERYAYDRYAPEQTESAVDERELDTADEDPDNIDDGVRAKPRVDVTAERPERKTREFEALDPERYAYDRYAPEQAENQPEQGAFEPG